MKKKIVKKKAKPIAVVEVERDNAGKFTAGNSAGGWKKKLPPDAVTKIEKVKTCAIDCAFMLTLTKKQIEKKLKKTSITGLEAIVGTAISKHNHRFIQWLLEMAIGRPPQARPDETNTINQQGVFMPVTREQQQSIIDMTLRAREEKTKEDKKKAI